MFNPNNFMAIVPKANDDAMIDIFPKDFHNGDLSDYDDTHYVMTLKESVEYIKKSGRKMVYIADEWEMEDYLKKEGMKC